MTIEKVLNPINSLVHADFYSSQISYLVRHARSFSFFLTSQLPLIILDQKLSVMSGNPIYNDCLIPLLRNQTYSAFRQSFWRNEVF